MKMTDDTQMELNLDLKDRVKLEQWLKCHAERPEVFELFDRYARELLRSGRERYSMDAIWNRMRWHSAVSTDEPEYKLSDKYRVFYGRYWQQLHPEYASFFANRISDADGFDLVAEVKRGTR
jgi:hypothetical protein